MASAAPLLPEGSVAASHDSLAERSTSGGGSTPGGFSVHSIGKLKMKMKKWRGLSQEHALDHAFVVGCRVRSERYVKAQTAAKFGTEEADLDDSDLQTNSDAVTNLLNNCLGSGIVCMPHMVKMLGLPVGVGVILMSAVLNRFMLLLVLRCCEIADVDVSYNTVAKSAFGNPGRLAVVFVFMAMGFGSLVTYFDGTKDSVAGLLDVMGLGSSRLNVLFASVLLIFPPTYIRSLSAVATLSLVAFIGAVVVVVCVLLNCGTRLVTDGLPSADLIRWSPDSFATVLAYVPTGICAMAIQAGGSIICSSLKDGSPGNRSLVTGIAYTICFAIFVSVAVPAYLVFLDETKGDVLEAFDPKNPITIIAKIGILDLLVLSYMFMMIPCRVATIELLLKKNEVKLEATWGEFAAVTTAINVLAVLVAATVSDLAFVYGLVGAVAANMVAFILPSMIYIKVRSEPKMTGMEAVPVFSPRNVPFFLLAGLATISMISAVYILLTQ